MALDVLCALFFLEELDLIKWVMLLVLAYFYYSWARDHLAFSPLLTMVVAAVLIYYLVFVYPWLGAIGFLFNLLMFSGLLFMLGVVAPFLWKLKKR
ncbi:MAG: hypothetical protein NTY90_05390 [Candidatus Micrarchaeota archaeon]|nr:hypothetical protein [Candidatus Micrarchaeota archaeon]